MAKGKKAGTATVSLFRKEKGTRAWVKAGEQQFTVEKPEIKAPDTLKVGDTIDIMKLISGTTVKPTSWTSSKTNVATIDENGLINIKGTGKATVSVFYGEKGKGSKPAKYKVKIKVK